MTSEVLREGSPIPDEYLSQVAHEMRGALNTILGWAEYLRGSAGDEQARLRAAGTIIRHARQQAWMVSELVDTCRLASGTFRLAATPLLFDDLVRSAIDAVEPIAEAKSVSLTRGDSNAVLAGSLRLLGDVRRLTQVLTSLLTNAIHFSSAGDDVDIVVSAEGDLAILEIRDRGLGLSPEAVRHLFERERPPSRAAGSPRRDFHLGLALARDVITRHGGVISAASTGGQGLTFRIQLPRVVGDTIVNDPMGQCGHGAMKETVHRPTAALPHDLTRENEGPRQLDGVRVLLVDDEADARDALVGILTHYGALVRAAGSAADAVAALNRERMDVLLADIGMPGEDGYDLIRSVRRLASGASAIPAVAVTAFTSDFDRRRAIEAGFQAYLSKPIDPSTLVATVAELSRGRTSIR